MTVTQHAPPAPDAGLLGELTVAELILIIAHLRVAWYATQIVEGPCTPLWRDLGELLSDAHASWCAAFTRETGIGGPS
jgi:hypothetical protein